MKSTNYEAPHAISPDPYYFLPFKYKHFPQQTALRHPQSVLLLMQKTNHASYKTRDKNYNFVYFNLQVLRHQMGRQMILN
jgi:hypothetical protein